MRSSSPSSAEPRAEAATGARAAALAGLLWLAAGTAPAAASALAECRAEADQDLPLVQCLEAALLASEVALAEQLESGLAAQEAYAALTGDARAGRSLGQAQQAFILYRDLDCEAVELGADPARNAEASRLACLIDHNRTRIARLAALTPPEDSEQGETVSDTVSDSDDTPQASPRMPIPADLAESSWQLASIGGDAVQSTATLAIDVDGGLSGNAGCNRYFGQADVTGDTVTITGLGSTRMACPEPQMEQERRFLEALEQATRWRLEDQTLHFADSSGTILLAFEPNG